LSTPCLPGKSSREIAYAAHVAISSDRAVAIETIPSEFRNAEVKRSVPNTVS
jgi:hypothetical protein